MYLCFNLVDSFAPTNRVVSIKIYLISFYLKKCNVIVEIRYADIFLLKKKINRLVDSRIAFDY